MKSSSMYLSHYASQLRGYRREECMGDEYLLFGEILKDLKLLEDLDQFGHVVVLVVLEACFEPRSNV